MILSIVIVTYLERNQKHLDLCLESILKQKIPIDYEIIVVSSGEYIPTVIKADNITHYHAEGRLHYPAGVNFGVEKTSPSSKLLMLCNDDLLFTKGSIMNMVGAMGDNSLILNPISSCDNFWRYILPLEFKKGEETLHFDKRFYTYEDLEPHFSDIFENFISLTRGLIFVPFAPLYCTMIPRGVWNKVGTLDPQYLTGQDDVDYGFRAKLQGIRSAVCLDSFVLHFGGQTADHALDDPIRNHNIAYFTKKWRAYSEIFSWL